MANTISVELQNALGRIRLKIDNDQMMPWFNSDEPNWQEDMVPLFPRLANWFPVIKQGSKEERSEIRHCILMALVGRPLNSQYELSVGIHRILKEVLRDNSAYLTRELADELQEAVQNQFSLTPWTVPAAISTIAGLRSVPRPDQRKR